MYSLELTCKLCGHVLYMQGNELWRIILKANELELLILSQTLCCNLCQEVGPIRMEVKNDGLAVVFFEKIISPTPTIGKSLIPADYAHHKPTMDDPCLACCATGRLEVQYKAHYNKDFKGIITEECPICEGKGYFK